MSTLASSEIIAAWTAKLEVAGRPFDGCTALPAWLADSARDQAERVFLVLDGTPIEARDMAMADRLLGVAGVAFLEAWAWFMAAFGADAEPWAKAAPDEAVRVFHDRLNELAPGLRAGGAA